jgi:hypothetical protein
MAFVRWVFVLAALMLGAPCGAVTQATPSAAASAVPAASSPLANLPLNRDASSSVHGGLPLVAQLALAVGLIAGLAAVYKLRQHRMGSGAAAPALRTLQTLRLTHGACLHVVRWGSQELLLACTAQSAVLLSRRKTGETGDQPHHGSAA